MGNVIQMHFSAAEQLRALADDIDSGKYPGSVLVLTDKSIHMCMSPWLPERASVEASYALQRALFQIHATGCGLMEGASSGR
jgi:hypothetical protein